MNAMKSVSQHEQIKYDVFHQQNNIEFRQAR